MLLIACSYLDQEFIRVGYYVYNEYLPFEGYKEETHGPPPEIESMDSRHIIRRILADKPRITRFPIHWPGTESVNLLIDQSISTPIHIDTATTTYQNDMNSMQQHMETINNIFKGNAEMTNISNMITSPFRSSMDVIHQTNAVTPDFL